MVGACASARFGVFRCPGAYQQTSASVHWGGGREHQGRRGGDPGDEEGRRPLRMPAEVPAAAEKLTCRNGEGGAARERPASDDGVASAMVGDTGPGRRVLPGPFSGTTTPGILGWEGNR